MKAIQKEILGLTAVTVTAKMPTNCRMSLVENVCQTPVLRRPLYGIKMNCAIAQVLLNR